MDSDRLEFVLLKGLYDVLDTLGLNIEIDRNVLREDMKGSLDVWQTQGQSTSAYASTFSCLVN